MQDLRDGLFSNIKDILFSADLIVERDGCLSGVATAREVMNEIGVRVAFHKADGERVKNGECIARLVTAPKQMTLAEERLMGLLSKYSGVATAAVEAVDLAAGRARIVSGSWKKMPPEIKAGLRRAVVDGGASFRISDTPMLYMDKNYIRMLGSIPAAMQAANCFPELNRVVQIRGITASIEEETRQAVEHGCGILMVDTGSQEDLRRCIGELERIGSRNRVEVAFSGNVFHVDICPLIECYGLDVLCIGKAIVDAPLLDMKLEVTGKAEENGIGEDFCGTEPA